MPPARAVMTVPTDETAEAAEIVERFLEASMVPDPDTAARYIADDLKITFTGGRKYSHPRETAAFNGKRYKLVNTLAIIFVVVVVYALNLPYAPSGVPWDDSEFVWSSVNYTPLAIILPLIFGLWYLVSAKDRYQGPVRTLEEDEVTKGL